VDPNGDIWIANYGDSTYALYNSSGTQITTKLAAPAVAGAESWGLPSLWPWIAITMPGLQISPPIR